MGGVGNADEAAHRGIGSSRNGRGRVAVLDITVLDEALVIHRNRSAHDSISDRRAAYTDCAYTFLHGLRAFLVRSGNDALYERDFINYAIHLLYIDLIADGRDAASRKTMQEKINTGGVLDDSDRK